jgi:hypothetical protein
VQGSSSQEELANSYLYFTSAKLPLSTEFHHEARSFTQHWNKTQPRSKGVQ